MTWFPEPGRHAGGLHGTIRTRRRSMPLPPVVRVPTSSLQYEADLKDYRPGSGT
jgi:hypothetical protein